MPIVTVSLTKPKSAQFKTAVLEAVHASLVSIGASPQDRFQRVFELEPQDFVYDPTYPDAKTPRNADFVLIEIVLGVGRSVKVKRALVRGIADRLAAAGLDPENAMICLTDVPWENLSPAGGRLPHA